LGGLIAGAVDGVAKDVLLSERYCPISGYWLKVCYAVLKYRRLC
jgi:hypothetical protein